MRTVDERLLELLRSGGEEALAELKLRYGALIRYIVDAILPDPRDAEECRNDVYLKLLSAAPTLHESRPLKPFITAVARNTAVSMARRRRGEETELDENVSTDKTPEEDLLRRERVEALQKALNALAPGDRRIIYRKYYYRQPTAQIAAELGLTERAVEGRLYRLRRRLRELLGGEMDG